MTLCSLVPLRKLCRHTLQTAASKHANQMQALDCFSRITPERNNFRQCAAGVITFTSLQNNSHLL